MYRTLLGYDSLYLGKKHPRSMSERSNMSADLAKIVLVPHERSHPFARRECVVREPLKVGRSVDKKRISTNNLIFDCRVLSRNHAVIWFENGKVRNGISSK